MRFIFVRTNTPTSGVICYFDGGAYNHVAVVVDDTWCIDCSPTYGVRNRLISSLLKTAVHAVAYDIEVDQKNFDNAHNYMLDLIDNHVQYDNWALLSLAIASIFGTAPNFSSADKMYCGELAGVAAIKAGIPVKGPTRLMGVEHLRLELILNKAKETILK